MVERKGEYIAIPDFTVIGSGEVGDKARQLMEKTQALKRIGFSLPHRTILAQGFFDEFFQSNGLGKNLAEVVIKDNTSSFITNRSLTNRQLETVRKISESYQGLPLVIRSSGRGDARGVGIYKSVVCNNYPVYAHQAIKEVLASYFTKDAFLFRRDAGVGNGFGVIIEPLIGQKIDKNLYAPLLSGFGYTSTPNSEGYVMAVPGFGCAVDTKCGERITKEDAEQHATLGRYLSQEIRAMHSEFARKPIRRSQLLKTQDLHFVKGEHLLQGFLNQPGINPGTIIFAEDNEQVVWQKIAKMDISHLFEMMEKLEKYTGKPQYFEWATTKEKTGYRYWIVQIADISSKVDKVDFINHGQKVVEAHSAINTGVRECKNIFTCWDFEDIPVLDEYNKTHENYVLLYSGKLSSYVGGYGLKYSHFSNACVLIESAAVLHSEHPLSHFGGQLDMTGKFYAILEGKNAISRDILGLNSQKAGPTEIFEGDFKVVSSEKHNRLVVYKTS